MVRRIYDQDEKIAVRDLSIFAKKGRRPEVTKELVKTLNKKTEEQALWFIKNLHQKQKMVKGTGKNQMDLKGTITTLDTYDTINVKMLVDSGCTGSCISEQFIAENKINTEEIARPIPIYNADGTTNLSGAITKIVRLRLTIGGHSEVMDFGVSSLGKTNIFLG